MKNLNLDQLVRDMESTIHLIKSNNYTTNDLIDFIADLQYEAQKALEILDSNIEEEEEE